MWHEGHDKYRRSVMPSCHSIACMVYITSLSFWGPYLMESELRTSMEKSVNFCSKNVSEQDFVVGQLRALQLISAICCFFPSLSKLFWKQSFGNHKRERKKNSWCYSLAGPFLKSEKLNFKHFTCNLSAHTLTIPWTPFCFEFLPDGHVSLIWTSVFTLWNISHGFATSRIFHRNYTMKGSIF